MENSHKTIGRVLSVDNFRVFIKLDEDLHGAYKSGAKDIYEIARINSYVIIPVGADRVVALITRVTMKEEMEFDKNTATITLPTSARYVSATMLGTITQENEKEKFIQGVYNFPSLDNQVWYVTENDLNHIFDNKENNNIKFETDFYLPIGTSPAFSDYKVKICPDQFFVKHAAILGNTGSGKSCTLTSILRNLFRYEYGDDNKLQNAHIIIFDTNGEYKNAFLPDPIPETEKQELDLINAYYYGGENEVKVPYWYMNWDEIKTFLKPSDSSQAPVLNRAIGLAKNNEECKGTEKFSEFVLKSVSDLINQLKVPAAEYWKIRNFTDMLNDLESQNLYVGEISLNDILANIPNRDGSSYQIAEPSKLEKIVGQLEKIIRDMENANIGTQIINEQNIDIPKWFSYKDLCKKFIDAAISKDNGSSNNKIQEYLSTLKLRMNSFLNDKRMAIPLMLKDEEKVEDEVLPAFIAFILGDFNRLFENVFADKENFITKYNKEHLPKNPKKTCQISIIDVSQLPFEVLEIITALLGRLIIEFVSNFLPEQRGNHPIVIVLEEAQNYIAEYKDSVAKTVFERIAREGRKYGISLIVSSQRPSELSKTVLSQCNSFIIHRLQNPEDQKYIRGIISSANEDLLDQLPIIPQQHAIITGDCVRTPIQVKIDTVNPTPNSHNPKFISKWLDGTNKIPYEDACKKWLGKEQKQD